MYTIQLVRLRRCSSVLGAGYRHHASGYGHQQLDSPESANSVYRSATNSLIADNAQVTGLEEDH